MQLVHCTFLRSGSQQFSTMSHLLRELLQTNEKLPNKFNVLKIALPYIRLVLFLQLQYLSMMQHPSTTGKLQTIISTEGALRRPTTSDDYLSIHPSSNIFDTLMVLATKSARMRLTICVYIVYDTSDIFWRIKTTSGEIFTN